MYLSYLYILILLIELMLCLESLHFNYYSDWLLFIWLESLSVAYIVLTQFTTKQTDNPSRLPKPAKWCHGFNTLELLHCVRLIAWTVTRLDELNELTTGSLSDGGVHFRSSFLSEEKKKESYSVIIRKSCMAMCICSSGFDTIVFTLPHNYMDLTTTIAGSSLIPTSGN